MDTPLDFRPFHFRILRFDSLASTNTEASARAEQGAPEGLCVVAGEQTAGRGRQGRAWRSPATAGLYFSIVLRPVLPVARLPLLTLMAALAVHHALLRTCNLATDIKWPNDILARERKLCGILAEAVETKIGLAVVLGIGINLRYTILPPELSVTATSIETEIHRAPDADELLANVLEEIRERYANLHTDTGARELLDELARASSYAAEKAVRVQLGSESFEGTTRGLAEDGALRVETRAGEIRIVRAGDVFALRAAPEANAVGKYSYPK